MPATHEWASRDATDDASALRLSPFFWSVKIFGETNLLCLCLNLSVSMPEFFFDQKSIFSVWFNAVNVVILYGHKISCNLKLDISIPAEFIRCVIRPIIEKK